MPDPKLRKLFLGFLCLASFSILLLVFYFNIGAVDLPNKIKSLTKAYGHQETMNRAYTLSFVQKPKRILFYNPCHYRTARGLLHAKFFQNCRVNNCKMSFKKSEVNLSDAVIIHPIHLKDVERVNNQIWVMTHTEAVRVYASLPTPLLEKEYNWTMTYTKQADIFLPMGIIRRKAEEKIFPRDYLAIAKNKTKDALWVVSHCHTHSKREEYVKILQKYINVHILGHCGEKWKCGARYNHASGHCFDILNSTYRYYLAFENALCEDYITEKFFENFNYDILQVMRGGKPNVRSVNISSSAYIYTGDFENAHALGKYLRSLSSSPSKYAALLKAKDEFESLDHIEVFQEAACELCRRLHDADKYRRVYKGVLKWMNATGRCFKPTDI